MRNATTLNALLSVCDITIAVENNRLMMYAATRDMFPMKQYYCSGRNMTTLLNEAHKVILSPTKINTRKYKKKP
jgi:hypothetical protein